MSYTSIHVEKLTPHTGAEVRGVDLARPLDARTFKEVHDALIEHGVIFFRDQHLRRTRAASSPRPNTRSSARTPCRGRTRSS
jgi:alpha-ketoglutarate-dependent taurine dioxygenase